MSCKDCLNNCTGTLTSDKCVKYTGPDNECLGICNGASLYEVLQALSTQACANNLETSILDIDLVCSFFSTIMGTSTLTAIHLIQALINGECQLKTAIDAINAQLNTPFTLNTSCLTLPASPTRDDILKAVVTLLCSVSSDVAIIKSDYTTNAQVLTIITNYLQSIGIYGGGAQEYTKMPKYVAMPYHGSLSNFTNNGTGLVASGYDKIYLCYGQTINGFTLPDYRGRIPVGVNSGYLTNIDPFVDPSNSNNLSIGLNDKVGNEFKHKLVPNENATHTHGIIEPNGGLGHDHLFSGARGAGPGGGGYGLDNDKPVIESGRVLKSVTGITLETSGHGDPHNNTQPSLGTNFIMYLP